MTAPSCCSPGGAACGQRGRAGSPDVCPRRDVRPGRNPADARAGPRPPGSEPQSPGRLPVPLVHPARGQATSPGGAVSARRTFSGAAVSRGVADPAGGEGHGAVTPLMAGTHGVPMGVTGTHPTTTDTRTAHTTHRTHTTHHAQIAAPVLGAHTVLPGVGGSPAGRSHRLDATRTLRCRPQPPTGAQAGTVSPHRAGSPPGTPD